MSDLVPRAMEAVGQGDVASLGALFLLVSLTEIGVPFPLVLDSILFLLGFQLGIWWWRAVLVILVLLLAREFGATTVYWLSHYVGNPLITWLGYRLPWLRAAAVRLTEKRRIQGSLGVVLSRLRTPAPMTASISHFGMRVSMMIAVARLTPGMLTATSIASGTIRLRYPYFAIGIGLASLFVDTAIITLGFITGYWLLRLGVAPSSWLIVVGLVVNLAIIWLVPYLLWRRNSRRSRPKEDAKLISS